MRNAILGIVNLTKKADYDKYHYSGCGISFDACGSFLLSYGGSGFGKNVIFGADMKSSLHIYNKGNMFLSWVWVQQMV